MGSTLRIKFATCLALFLLSGCSFFNDSVEDCEEPQEYQESASIPPLIVPNYLKNIQNKSIFNIPNTQGNNAFAEESFTTPMAFDESPNIAEQYNQMGYIEGDELSELLQLIDQTISNRQVEAQFEPIYENVINDYESNSSLKPCLDGPPRYFSEKISPRSMPTQAYTQPSGVYEAEEEKSRRQKRRENRQQKTDKQTGEGTEEDASSQDTEVSANKEDKTAKRESIFKSITSIATSIYTGGTFEGGTLSGGKPIIPPKPIKPGEAERTIAEESALADRIRNLAILDPALSDVDRTFIQNMSDQQILEMAGVVMKEKEDQDSAEKGISDEEIIEEKDATVPSFKDQWAEAKAQREERREARQERRAERKSQDD